MKALALLFCLIGQLLIAEPSVLTDPQPATDNAAQTDQGGGTDINTLFSGVNTQGRLKLEFNNLPSRPYVGEINP